MADIPAPKIEALYGLPGGMNVYIIEGDESALGQKFLINGKVCRVVQAVPFQGVEGRIGIIVEGA